MKTGWKTSKLDDVALLRPKKNEVKSILADADVVSFVPMDCLKVDQVALAEHEARPLYEVYGGYTYFCDGDVLLAKITPCFENGKLGIADGLTNGVGFGSSEFFVLRPSNRVLAGYLYHFLNRQSFRDWAKGQMTGAVGHKRVPKDLIETLEIPLPPLEEQHRIVAVLDEAFEGLARARAHAETNLQNARELFPSALGSLFGFESEDWPICSVDELVSKKVLSRPLDGNHGETHPKKADFVSSGVPFVMASDLVDGVVDQVGCNFISRNQSDALRKGFAKDGDVLLSHKGTIGRAAILETDLDYVMLTPQVTYYRVDDPTALDRNYLFYVFQSGPFQEKMQEIAKGGATRAYIGITKQLELTIPVPTLEHQRSLVEKAQRIETASRIAVRDYIEKLLDIDELRQSLLHKAFAGKLV